MPKKQPGEFNSVLSEGGSSDANVLAAASYLLGMLTGVAVYLIEKEDKFIRFHAVQSILLGCVVILVGFLLVISIIGILILPIYFIVSFILWVIMMYKAYNGERFKLPYLGDYAERYC